jgi:hopanoid biosynthesis associated protein HpnK
VSRLIVNADDFGLTAGVNRAIVELHAAGVLTSASLMARAASTRQAIELAHRAPSLGVGCHVVLADGEPVLPASQIPSLIDGRTGQFLPTLGAFLLRLFSGAIRSSHIEAEAAAQIDFQQSMGLKLDHFDTHKHLHMFPAVLSPLLRAARAAGIRAIRNPFEPEWAVRATGGASWPRRAQVRALRGLAPFFRRRVAQQGFSTTDGAIAVVGTGTLDASTVRALLAHLPAGTWELVTHPGYNDADLDRIRTRLRAAREVERNALAAIGKFPHIELVSFATLPRPQTTT